MGAISVYFHRAALPTVSQWNDALRAEGFDLAIDPFDLEQDDGYRPAMLCGQETAFDWGLYPVDFASEDAEVAAVIRPIVGDRDVQATLHGTQEIEEATLQIAGALLAKITNGCYWNREESGIDLLPADEAIALAKKALTFWKEHPGQ